MVLKDKDTIISENQKTIVNYNFTITFKVLNRDNPIPTRYSNIIRHHEKIKRSIEFYSDDIIPKEIETLDLMKFNKMKRKLVFKKRWKDFGKDMKNEARDNMYSIAGSGFIIIEIIDIIGKKD